MCRGDDPSEYEKVSLMASGSHDDEHKHDADADADADADTRTPPPPTRGLSTRQVAYLICGICIGIITSKCYLNDRDSPGIESNSAADKVSATTHCHCTKDGWGDDVDSDVASYCKDKSRKQCPPISKFVKGYKVKGDISWMLDFAIIGSAKCGTSFLLRYLGNSTETLMPPFEVCKMSKDRPDEMANLYYNVSLVSGKYRNPVSKEGGEEEEAAAEGLEMSPRIHTGLKCPKELATEKGLTNYAKYFPKMKYIVTMRHPISWFQSFYNYRVYGNGQLPPPKELIGSCVENSPYICSKRCAVKTHTQNVCTDRAKFHHQLSRFGKTPMDTREENDLLRHDMDIVPSHGKIFLMDIGQLFPSEKASKHLARDLTKFLGLQHQLTNLEDVVPDSSKYVDKERRKYFIRICDAEHKELRKVLLDIGREAYVWIRDYFIKSPDVVVSSRDDFLELISKWQYDPCDEEGASGNR